MKKKTAPKRSKSGRAIKLVPTWDDGPVFHLVPKRSGAGEARVSPVPDTAIFQAQDFPNSPDTSVTTTFFRS